MSLKKLIAVVSIVLVTAVYVPMAALAIAAVWLLYTSPIWFGVMFMSATTLLVLKNLALAAAVFVILALVAFFAKRASMKEEGRLENVAAPKV